jgi:AcrR family transcriptional regulator
VQSAKQLIIHNALQAFMRHGFKAVTVDDIALANSISKKTLYEHFTDKDEIVRAAVALLNKQIEQDQDAIIARSHNAIEEVALIMQLLENKFQSMNVNCFLDLQKYYPSALTDFSANKQEHISILLNNIKRGIKEGFYRKNLNVELVASLRMETMFYFLSNNTAMQKFSFIEMQLQQVQLFLYGICTVKGHELIDNYMAQLKKKKVSN